VVFICPDEDLFGFESGERSDVPDAAMFSEEFGK
jgi:hypothetical protein